MCSIWGIKKGKTCVFSFLLQYVEECSLEDTFPCFVVRNHQKLCRVHCKSRLTMTFYSFFYVSIHTVLVFQPCYFILFHFIFRSFSFVLCYFFLRYLYSLNHFWCTSSQATNFWCSEVQEKSGIVCTQYNIRRKKTVTQNLFGKLKVKKIWYTC